MGSFDLDGTAYQPVLRKATEMALRRVLIKDSLLPSMLPSDAFKSKYARKPNLLVNRRF